MNEPKSNRRWFTFSIRGLLLLMVIAALATGWWLDHRRLMALLPSSNPPEYLVELNLSRDEKISMLNRQLSEFETIYDNATAANDDKWADAAKKQIDQLKMRKNRRSDELRPKIVDYLRHEMDNAQGKSNMAH